MKALFGAFVVMLFFACSNEKKDRVAGGQYSEKNKMQS